MNIQPKEIKLRNTYIGGIKQSALDAKERGVKRAEIRRAYNIPDGTLGRWFAEDKQFKTGVKIRKARAKKGPKPILDYELLKNIIHRFPKANYKQLTAIYNEESGKKKVCINTVRSGFILMGYKKRVHKKRFPERNAADEYISKKK